MKNIFLLITLLFSKPLYSDTESKILESFNEMIKECEKGCDTVESQFDYALALIVTGSDIRKGWGVIQELNRKKYLPAIYLTIEKLYSSSEKVDGKKSNIIPINNLSKSAVEILSSKGTENWDTDDSVNLSFFMKWDLELNKI